MKTKIDKLIFNFDFSIEARKDSIITQKDVPLTKYNKYFAYNFMIALPVLPILASAMVYV